MSNNIRWQEHPACGKSHLGGGIRNITPFLFPTLFQFDLVRPNLCFDPVLAVLYADNRGVSRIYKMSLAENVWKIWRAAPGFHQRFIGRISPDQRSIEACWEKSNDGFIWENDFDLTYTKAKIPFRSETDMSR